MSGTFCATTLRNARSQSCWRLKTGMMTVAIGIVRRLLDQPEFDFQRAAQHLSERDVRLLDAGGGIAGNDQQMVGEAGQIAAALAGQGSCDEAHLLRPAQR